MRKDCVIAREISLFPRAHAPQVITCFRGVYVCMWRNIIIAMHIIAMSFATMRIGFAGVRKGVVCALAVVLCASATSYDEGGKQL